MFTNVCTRSEKQCAPPTDNEPDTFKVPDIVTLPVVTLPLVKLPAKVALPHVMLPDADIPPVDILPDVMLPVVDKSPDESVVIADHPNAFTPVKYPAT